MFTEFFYSLKERGVPVTPTSFIRLQEALAKGVINSLDDFYIAARAILVKSERYFDTYDQVFSHHFQGVELPVATELEISSAIRSMLDEWLRDPAELARALGLSAKQAQDMSAEELLQYFMDRLKEQKEAHHGGNRWIGTRGTSPVGHSGYNPGGMRVGGASGGKSASKVALERRYRDYAQMGILTESQVGEALKRLRNMQPFGPRDVVNIGETIYETMRKGGEIEIVFARRLSDRLKVILLIDNGGWSMDPYIPVVQTLFDHARSHFKELTSYYFHNTIYSEVWHDPQRWTQPKAVEEFSRLDPETRIIFIGDASMGPYELMNKDGSIYVGDRQSRASIDRLQFIARTFRHSVWLNPLPAEEWGYAWTVGVIGSIFPMFELSLDGLEKAVTRLKTKG
ncbi:MAG: hypothetical protein K9K75_00515 [Deltaproteobacteria bacterium]|nr:hypothetical protein [Deltaproteobacteria bacterium]